jgi:hypothetical protein
MNEPRATIYESPDADKQFFSLGHMAAMFQRPVQTLRMILAASGHKPAYTENDIPFFDGLALLAVSQALREGAADE